MEVEKNINVELTWVAIPLAALITTPQNRLRMIETPCARKVPQVVPIITHPANRPISLNTTGRPSSPTPNRDSGYLFRQKLPSINNNKNGSHNNGIDTESVGFQIKQQ